MSITSKGRRWEILHSLWVGWTFTLGFFNWVAFFYIALRARRRMWAVWGALYSIPFILAMIFANTPTFAGWIGDVTVALTLLLGIVSIFHAFNVRKEYLLRLDTLQRRKSESDTLLRRRLAAEPGTENRQETSSSEPTASNLVIGAREREQRRARDTPIEDVPSQSRTASSSESGSQPTIKSIVVPPDVLSKDELEYQISSSYPFPLAFGFRSLASVVDPRDLYREQLRVTENMLAFLGSVSLALLCEEDREQADIDPREYWLTGVSPGDWRDIVARCSKVFAGYEENSLARAIQRLNVRSEKKGFGADMVALIRAKNDYKHDRGPVVLDDIVNASGEVQEKLRRCMEALAFSTAYPIRQVEDFDVARRGGGVILKCLRYTGDHPSFPQEEVHFHQALPRGDLFLDHGQPSWAPLFPFMVTKTCPHGSTPRNRGSA